MSNFSQGQINNTITWYLYGTQKTSASTFPWTKKSNNLTSIAWGGWHISSNLNIMNYVKQHIIQHIIHNHVHMIGPLLVPTSFIYVFVFNNEAWNKKHVVCWPHKLPTPQSIRPGREVDARALDRNCPKLQCLAPSRHAFLKNFQWQKGWIKSK